MKKRGGGRRGGFRRAVLSALSLAWRERAAGAKLGEIGLFREISSNSPKQLIEIFRFLPLTSSSTLRYVATVSYSSHNTKECSLDPFLAWWWPLVPAV